VAAQISGEGDWLLGTWEGALVGLPESSNPRRSLKILSIAPDGTGQGTWFITGGEEYLAKIRAVDGQRLQVFSVVNTTIELTRQGEDRLVGSFTPAKRRTDSIALTKVNGPPDPAVADLQERWSEDGKAT
jgi:hypothetical protein